jgi:lipopolysaccharide export system permease protein
MHFDIESLKGSITPPRARSLGELFQQLLFYAHSNSTRGAEVTAYFLYKLTLPLLCILAPIAVAPFCLHFRKMQPILMTYLLAIAAFFSINLLFEAAFVIGKSELVSPYFAFFFPWICLFYIFGRKYQKL